MGVPTHLGMLCTSGQEHGCSAGDRQSWVCSQVVSLPKQP